MKNDSIAVSVEGDSKVEVNGGAGNDTLTVRGAGGASTGDTPEETAAFGKNYMRLNGGAGDDVITVDVTAANNAGSVTVDGGAGKDRLHFTGELMKDGAGSTVKNDGGSPVIELKNSDERLMKMTLAGIEDFTDALKNKKEIVVKESDVKTENTG